jgi:hypothetical protein
MGIDYYILKQELLTDPASLGYAARLEVGDHSSCAAILNEVRSTISVPRASIDTAQVIDGIGINDLPDTATALQIAWLNGLLNLPSIKLLKSNGTDSRSLTNLLGLLTGNSADRVRTMAIKTGSRMEELFGDGTVASHTDIAQALRS